MTLPINTLRHAPEPISAPPGVDSTGGRDERRNFGHALEQAMHDSPTSAREAATSRPTRVRRESQRAEAGDSTSGSALPDDSSISTTVARTARSTSRAPSDTATSDTATSDTATSVTMASETTTSKTTASETTASETTASEITTFETTTSETAVADTTSDAALGATGPAAETVFVAQSLEAAVTPNAPLALVAAAATADTASPRDSHPTAATMPGHGGPSVAEHASAIALRSGASERAADVAERRDAIAAAMARNPLAVRRDMDGLAPELRARLERVVDRMEQEYGYTVEVVETLRTPARQEALFAQGRTAPGPVVTWTKHSKHLTGSAADVVIDGGYDNAAGFERLARVAREEGLRTLWPRDPGHVELPGASSGQSTAGSRLPRASDAPPVAAEMPATDAAPVPVPRTTRSAIDPRGGGRLREVPAFGPDGVRTLPIAPAHDDPHSLPFSMPDLQLPTGEADMRALPMRPDLAGELPLAGRRQLSPAAVSTPGTPASPTVVASAGTAAAQATGGVARVAAVAQVATVATVATVASVARVATVGSSGVTTSTRVRRELAAPLATDSGPDSLGPLALPQSAVAPGSIAGSDAHGGRGAGTGGRGSDERGERDGVEMETATPTVAADPDFATQTTLGREGVTFDRGERGATDPVGGLTRSDATERIARVLRIQEAASDRPMSSVLLRLDHPDGGEDRIRIDLRGQTIGATLDIADPRAAERLRAHAPELQQALQRQGLEGGGESMVVRSNSRTMDASALTASAMAGERDVARAASATASDGGGSTARDSRNQPRAGSDRDGTDQQRSRQRRDGKGDTR